MSEEEEYKSIPQEKTVIKTAKEVVIEKFKIYCPYCFSGYVDAENFPDSSDPRYKMAWCANPDCGRDFRISQIPKFTF
jgi:transposase-like protein